MDVQAISGAATIASVCTLGFLILSLLAHLSSRLLTSRRSFREAIVRESAHRYRNELTRMANTQRTSLFALVLFSALFATAYALNASALYESYPEWQLWLLLVVVVAAAVYMLARLATGFVRWRRLCFTRDAVVAVGHGLERLSAEHGQVFHDVETDAGTIDHVVVGMRGVYGVHVVARKVGKASTVSADRGSLFFSEPDERLSVASMRKKNQALSKQLSALCDGRINVRLVVGVPGWTVDQQGDNSLLIVNERTLPMIKGWRDTQDFMLNDTVDAITAEVRKASALA